VRTTKCNLTPSSVLKKYGDDNIIINYTNYSIVFVLRRLSLAACGNYKRLKKLVCNWSIVVTLLLPSLGISVSILYYHNVLIVIAY